MTYINDRVRQNHAPVADGIGKSEPKKLKKIDEFLCAQTAYINSLTTYNEVDLATQHAIEHLIFT